ncbi:MAG: hypothetical protein AAF743_15370 [Planctomycetota bacterium]
MPGSILAFPLVLALVAPTNPDGLTREQMLEALRAEAQALIDDSRPDRELDERSRSELLRIFVGDDLLRVEVLLEEAVPMSAVPVSDFPGLCTIFIRNPGFDATLRHQTTDADGRSYQTTEVSYHGDRLSIARGYESIEFTGSVQLLQNLNPNFPSDAPVTLRIDIDPTDTDDTEAVEPLNLYLTASSFTDLRKRFPDEVDEHLMPLLTDLAPGFGPYPPGSARQVLMAELDVDPATRAKVSDLMPKLDDESFRVRHAARQALLDVGPDAATVALELLPDASPEQSAALSDLIRAYGVLDDSEAEALRDDVAFLVHALSDDAANVRRAARDRIAELRPDAALPNVDRPVSYQLRQTLLESLGLAS